MIFLHRGAFKKNLGNSVLNHSLTNSMYISINIIKINQPLGAVESPSESGSVDDVQPQLHSPLLNVLAPHLNAACALHAVFDVR